MRITITLSVGEVAVLVANHIAETLGIPVCHDDVISTGYGGYKLGGYDGFHYPAETPEPAKAVPAPVEPNTEASPPDSPEAAPAEVAAPEPF